MADYPSEVIRIGQIGSITIGEPEEEYIPLRFSAEMHDQTRRLCREAADQLTGLVGSLVFDEDDPTQMRLYPKKQCRERGAAIGVAESFASMLNDKACVLPEWLLVAILREEGRPEAEVQDISHTRR